MLIFSTSNYYEFFKYKKVKKQTPKHSVILIIDKKTKEINIENRSY